MLQFFSANTRIANSTRAIEECMELAFADNIPSDLKIVIVNATVGHTLEKLANPLKEKLPEVTVLASSCAGVVGKTGAGESLYDIAMMAVSGPPEEIAYSAVDDVYGENSYEKGLALAQDLKKKLPETNIIYLLTPGIATANDLFIKAIDETFGKDVIIFGGPSGDNMKAVTTYQYTGDELTERGAWAVGFADPSLMAITRAAHGFTAYGEPMVVTKAEGNKIIELDGKPAWETFTSRLALSLDAGLDETIPVGALAEELPPEVAEEYGNAHLLSAITKRDEDGAVYPNKTYPVGQKLWLTMRDENLIFSEQTRSLDFIKKSIGMHDIVAIFQTDCLARGRLLFNKVVKDELIALLHSELSNDGVVPPWIGMYGFGEFTRLGGKNEYHNYSTALLVLYR